MAEITKMPNRSPRVTSKSHIAGQGVRSYPSPKGGGFETIRISPDKPANENVTRAKREAAIRAKYPNPAGSQINYSYGSKTPAKPSMASRAASAVGKGVSSLAKGARIASPAGAFVEGMGLRPAGEGSTAPPKVGMSLKERSAANKATSVSRPTSNSLNAPVRTSPSGSARPTSNNLNSPSRTQSSKPTASKSTGPSRGPTSAPSRTQPSKANLGTSRFAKGGAIKRRKK